MDDLIARLTAAIDETETAARAALAGYPSTMGGGYDGCEPAIMSSIWQAAYHEVLQVMTEEPSAAFIARHVPGASVERMKRRKVADCGPANVYPAQHIARHDPASVLRGCAADRKLLVLHEHETIPENRRDTHDDATFGCMTCHNDHDYEQTWGGGWCEHVQILAERYGLEVQGG